MDKTLTPKGSKALALFRWFARGAFSVLAFFTFRCHVTNFHNIHRKGPIIVIANHPSFADPVLIGIKLHRQAVFMAKEELFANRIAAKLLHLLGAFPVSRERTNRRALAVAQRSLEQGLALVIFPEGGRSRKGEMRRGTAGAAMFAVRNKVPILPVGIYGPEKAKGPFWFFRRPRVEIVFGKPFNMEKNSNTLEKEYYSIMVDRMMHKITELIPKEYHGYYTRGEE